MNKKQFGGYKDWGITENLWTLIIVPAIKNKWDNRCSSCYKKHKRLHIHHKDYEIQTINSLVPLCPKCHKAEHKD